MATKINAAQSRFLVNAYMFAQMNGPGIPTPYGKNLDGCAKVLERMGLVERHHVGRGFGVVITAKGVAEAKLELGE